MLRHFTSLLFAACIVFAALGFAACSKKSNSEQPVTIGFSCDVDVQYQDMNVKGHLTRSIAGTLTLDVKEPATLNGLSMQWNGDKITLKLHGLSFDVNPDSIPQSALGKSMLSVLDAALGIRDGGEMTEEGLLTKGTASSGEFEITSDPKTGNLLKLSMPKENLTAKFSNFTITAAPAGAATAAAK